MGRGGLSMSVGLLLKAFVARRTGLAPGATIPRIELRREGVRVDPAVLARYRRMCGFADGADLPMTFPQMLAGELHIGLLADARFPLPVAGIVHFENRIEQLAPLPADATYDLTAWVEGHREAPSRSANVLFDIETRLSRAGREVWSATTTVLSRTPDAKRGPKGPKTPKAPKAERPAGQGLDTAPLRTAMFRLPADLGRRYSALAGDYNPIHLSALTARPFGFKRAIIHGMWSLARCLGEAADDLPPTPRTCTVRFERPVFLPGRVHLVVTPSAAPDARPGDVDFALTSPDLRTRHFAGSVRGV